MSNTAEDKFNHWYVNSFIYDDEGELRLIDLKEAFIAGFNYGKNMERAMWEMATEDWKGVG